MLRDADASVQLSEKRLILKLPVAQPLSVSQQVSISLKFIDPNDKVRSSSEMDTSLKPVQREISAFITDPLHGISLGEQDDLFWYRLSYEVRSHSGQILASGIVPVSVAHSELFRIAVAYGRLARAGRSYEVEVNAVNPVTHKPVRAVAINGLFGWGEDAETNPKSRVTTQAITDVAGNAHLSFNLPPDIAGEAGLSITAVKGVLTRKVEQDVNLTPAKTILLDTDKPIYQPGQTLHLRSLLVDSQHKALPKADLEISIHDLDDTDLFHQTVTTDSFGVAHTDWTIPSNLRLGTYIIEAAASEVDVDDSWMERFTQDVHIYRYDLPNFAVAATPDRTYYLPGQNASIKIAANYLFGKPVKRAKVRVVEEEERHWNYHEQKWDVDESEPITGELNENGEFTAQLDLSTHHEDLQKSTYTRFRNIEVAAYVTDLTTGRTEQRRIELRITRDPIHVYFYQSSRHSTKAPLNAYISTFYADGTPARCSVDVSAVDDDKPEKTRHFLQTVKTNKYGLARLNGVSYFMQKDALDSLMFEARDARGLAGKEIEYLWSSNSDQIRVSTPHTLYKANDGLEVSLQGTQPEMHAVVNVTHDGEILASRRVTLHNGKAFIVFPYDPRFTGAVSIYALSLENLESEYDYSSGTRTVLFPKKRQLGLQVKFDKDTYRPGEKGSALVAVKLPDGTATESELGVKIVDQAVEERARTDMEFGSSSRRWSYWGLIGWGMDNNFGGMTRDDLDNLDLTEPITDDLDLVAEYMMNSVDSSTFQRVELSNQLHSAKDTFSRLFDQQFKKLDQTIDKEVAAGRVVKNLQDVIEIGKKVPIDVTALRDPWGTPYRFNFSFVGKEQLVTVTTAGPNKRFDDEEAFAAYTLSWQYFQHTGQIVDKTSQEYFVHTGKFLRDESTFRSELLARGIDFEKLRDPWGNPYEVRFDVNRSYLTTKVISRGPNPSSDPAVAKKNEIEIWRNDVDFFSVARQRVDTILNKHLQSGGAFPANEAEFKALLKQSGADFDTLQDPWGNPYYIVIRTQNAYSQKFIVTKDDQRISIPVTMVDREISVHSPGYDKVANTKDDFEIARYSALVSEEKAGDSAPQPVANSPALNGNTGALRGVVTDPSGAVVAGATVTAVREGSDVQYKEKTNGEGKFVLLNLPPGLYNLRIESPGFAVTGFAAIPVRSVTLTELNVMLHVGEVSETVSVSAEAVSVQTDSASVSSVVSIKTATSGGKLTAASTMMMSTPRLREYFPETMLWEPALVTNQSGHAKLNFKMADNITTWKLTAIASTKTGELGTINKDLRSFQPFFVEHDPPRILTEGDEISYPVVLRNYLDKLQSVQATIKPETWFQLLSPGEQKVSIEAGDAANALFRYRAVASVEGGKQRITAANTEISDAIEKPLDVHPYGRPDSQNDSALLDKAATLHLHVAENAVPGSLRTELKIYPSLMGHVIESVEAVLERPYGCGEQTISSTYPSLLVVKFYKQRGGDLPPIAIRAQRYLQAGYERLLRYQDSTGGFTYWGHGDPDLALTTYALAFLTDASHLISVDSSVVQQAGAWLLQQQQKDGSWRAKWQNTGQAIIETSYIARVLAELPAEKEFQSKRDEGLKRALQYLASNRSLVQEPFAIASNAIAAQALGDQNTANMLLDTLRKTSHAEGDTKYWDLQTNTPFFCWGRTGRLESTALVIRALHNADKKEAVDQDLIRRATLFLMRNQDRYGIWYTGQTTVNVLQTLMNMLSSGKSSASTTLHVLVNGKDSDSIALPSSDRASALLRTDLTTLTKPGDNLIELKIDDGTSLISAQVVSTYYTPWPNEKNTDTTKLSTGELRLNVSYSKTEAKEDDTIECHVKAERVGFRGYGMMLAEIGLPPGVDVNRESLDAAVANNWTIDHYDVLPDHVVLYLWPTAGGADLTFKFRLRFAMQAETAPSMIYDYYNPDAVVIVSPKKFSVEEKAAMVAARRNF